MTKETNTVTKGQKKKKTLSHFFNTGAEGEIVLICSQSKLRWRSPPSELLVRQSDSFRNHLPPSDLGAVSDSFTDNPTMTPTSLHERPAVLSFSSLFVVKVLHYECCREETVLKMCVVIFKSEWSSPFGSWSNIPMCTSALVDFSLSSLSECVGGGCPPVRCYLSKGNLKKKLCLTFLCTIKLNETRLQYLYYLKS